MSWPLPICSSSCMWMPCLGEGKVCMKMRRKKRKAWRMRGSMPCRRKSLKFAVSNRSDLLYNPISCRIYWERMNRFSYRNHWSASWRRRGRSIRWPWSLIFLQSDLSWTSRIPRVLGFFPLRFRPSRRPHSSCWLALGRRRGCRQGGHRLKDDGFGGWLNGYRGWIWLFILCSRWRGRLSLWFLGRRLNRRMKWWL